VKEEKINFARNSSQNMIVQFFVIFGFLSFIHCISDRACKNSLFEGESKQ
jgi:hypothetical protein